MTLPISVGWTRSSYTVIPSRSTGVTFTASGRSTRPLTTNSRKACIAKRELSRGRSGPGGFTNKTGHRVGRLRAFADPILHPFVIEHEVVALLQRLIGADFLNELAVARAAIVRHDNAEHGVVLGPDSFHAYSHCHKSRFSGSGAPKDTSRPAPCRTLVPKEG